MRKIYSLLAMYSVMTLTSVSAYSKPIQLDKNDTIVLLGNGYAERMLHHGHFETEIQLRNPNQNLTIRTLAKPGYTPGFRPHSSRNSQWAFPGAEKFHPDKLHHSGEGHHPSSDEWLKIIKPDLILTFFGFNESFDGKQGLDNFKNELTAFIKHTRSQNYSQGKPVALALVSPIAFQNLSDTLDLPAGVKTNQNLKLYSQAMKQVADMHKVSFIDAYAPSQTLFQQSNEPLTVNGAHLNNKGYKKFAPILADLVFGQSKPQNTINREDVNKAVLDKNWYWMQTYLMPNGVHVDGRRFDPFGPENYPHETTKVRQMTDNRDKFTWSLLANEPLNLAELDKHTLVLPEVKSNVKPDAVSGYLYGEDAVNTITTAEGYKIEMFASEVEFPNLANPAQLSFDDKGRLWVATLASYPHHRPGDGKPNDKILIYQDTNNDGKADKEIIFADNLNLPIGFEITEYGVYVSQAPNLVLLKDLDGDDKADSQEIILSGFDTHDTHHAISGFEADPSGSIIMQEGVFLHSNIETAYGPVRTVNGGFYRFTPRTQKLQRMVQNHVTNPWGLTHDKWGQGVYLNTSSPEVYWMTPVEVKTRYGQLSIETETLIEPDHRVRPTSGIEFISSQHFPDDVQGDFLLNNVIGYLGAKQHTFVDDGTGYVSKHRLDLYKSTDPNFRPVDIEFAPDGSLYMVDWHNQLIGHMQHNARDPLRDHAHGRIYRVTYPAKPLTPPPSMNVDAKTLYSYLTRPEDRIRFRARRVLRGLPEAELLKAKKAWVASLNQSSDDYERLLLEGLWTSNSDNNYDHQLIRTLLNAKSFKIRAAAVKELRHRLPLFDDAAELLKKAASDKHGRVRLEAITAATWLDNQDTLDILYTAGKHPIDDWIKSAFMHGIKNAGGEWEFEVEESSAGITHLTEAQKAQYDMGKTVYNKEGYCGTCHQADGAGLPVAGFPPLAGTTWVNGNPERLVDIILHGLMGKMIVNGKQYNGHVPMTPFKGMLTNEEAAAVATYVRNAFGNKGSTVSPETVEKVRNSKHQPQGFWTVKQLEDKYPSEDLNKGKHPTDPGFKHSH